MFRAVFSWLINLGTKSGLPKYSTFVGFLYVMVALVPESTWIALGMNVTSAAEDAPKFIQYYINSTDFKNTMMVFIVLSPVILIINTALFIHHINFNGYTKYLKRREAREAGNQGLIFILPFVIFILGYIWATFFSLEELSVFRGFVPEKNRLALIFLQGGMCALVLPVFLSLIVTEIRASFN